MLLFKACPRCGGDVHIEVDVDHKYITGVTGTGIIVNCLMCGATKSIIIPNKKAEVA